MFGKGEGEDVLCRSIFCMSGAVTNPPLQVRTFSDL